MSTTSSTSSAAWPTACVGVSLLCLLAALLPQPWALQNLSFDAQAWRTQLGLQAAAPSTSAIGSSFWAACAAIKPWTLWTGALVHLGPAHLWANLGALVALAVLGHQQRLPASAAWGWLLAWPLTTLALLAWPEVGRYSGLSGLIHANVAVIWSYVAIKNKAKWLSFVLLSAMALKLLHERAWQSAVVYSPDWGFEVVVAAHLAGAGIGALCGLSAVVSFLIRNNSR